MHAMKRLTLLVVLAAAAVASTANAQTTLRYQFKEGDKLQYTIDQKMKMAMKLMDQNIDTKMNMFMDMTWNVLKVDKDGNAQVQIKVPFVKVTMDGPTGLVEADSNSKQELDDPIGKIVTQMAKAMATMEVSGTMLPTGEIKDAKVSEETLKALKNLPGADKMGDMLNSESFKAMVSSIIFPTEAISTGKTWTNKTENKTPFGKTSTQNTFTYEGTTDKDGATLQKIAVKPAIKIEADPNAKIKIEIKDAKGSGTVLFDNKTGRLVESVTNQTTEMQIGAMGLNLSQTIDQTTTIRLKKK